MSDRKLALLLLFNGSASGMQITELTPRWYDFQHFYYFVEFVAQFHPITLLRTLIHVLDSPGMPSPLYDKADFVDHGSHLLGRLPWPFSGQVDKAEFEGQVSGYVPHYNKTNAGVPLTQGDKVCPISHPQSGAIGDAAGRSGAGTFV